MRPDDTRTIPLSQGKVALVDAADYERIMAAGPWHAVFAKRKNGRSTWYARHTSRSAGNVYMHRFVVSAPEDDCRKTPVDHRDGNGLDNRRTNLRIATPSLNTRNNGHARSNTGLRGVQRFRDKYRAMSRLNGRRVYIGVYDTPEECAAAYRAYTARQYEDCPLVTVETDS